MKYVTIRLLVDDERAERLLHALETTRGGTAYFGAISEPETLHSFEVNRASQEHEQHTHDLNCCIACFDGKATHQGPWTTACLKFPHPCEEQDTTDSEADPSGGEP
jgi:hypothetical protein